MSSNKPDRQIALLARKWQEGTITDQEKQQLDDWYASFDHTEETGLLAKSEAQVKERLYRNILNREHIRPSLLRIWLPRVAAVLLLGSSLFFLARIRPENRVLTTQRTPKSPAPILPGSNKALLTLADGSTISLDQHKDGLLAEDRNLAVSKKQGQLIYSSADPSAAAATDYHTISTPRGGQYQVDLPDGSRVWLNAASSIRFPLRFGREARQVQIKGEVYFEVAKQQHAGKKTPFIVESAGQQIEVLGTHFNVNAYENEPGTRTTLLEGSVRVKKTETGETALLRPGQQAVLAGSVQVHTADTENAVAWQKGYFAFNNETVESIMRTVARWYDVDVEISRQIRGRRFGGTISRFDQLSTLLGMMEKTGVIHFRIEGRRVIVMP
ncbi:hypothetical protein C7T94_07545 [Pedobacter yulinensis]|uniref:Anti-sigma factor n=1 Tax=Pedobacter yulinensis TaxID=2126353 RepID=A0A2T3HJG3_9SPHI|nr:FecR domain-containing protein [Pedobacter yulinensis]PST82521.1 hypothetical protein C7T94_07545 [Pedobacter yulinensis]